MWQESWYIRHYKQHCIQHPIRFRTVDIGQCKEIFCFKVFFHESSSSKPSNLLKICVDIRMSRCTSSINTTSGKFATGINVTGGKFCLRYCWRCWYEWQIFHRCQWNQRQICHRCQRNQRQIGCRCQQHLWQIISDCWHLKVNLKEKMYLYVNSTTKSVPKNNENFLIEDFIHLLPVSMTPVVHLELRISPRILEKTQGLGGNWFMKNTWNWSRKSRGTVPLKVVKNNRGQKNGEF